MDTKNVLMAVILSSLVLLTWAVFFEPPQVQVEEKKVESVKQEFRDIEEKIDEISSLPFSNFVPNVVEEATEKVEEVREAIEEKVDSVIENVEETVDEVVERVEDIVPNAHLLEQKLAETRKKIIESQSPRGIIGWILSLFGIKG